MTSDAGPDPGRGPAADNPKPSPWAQLPTEPPQAFLAFQAYLKLGPNRSYDAAYRQARPGCAEDTRAPGGWRKWCKSFDWQGRARAYDERDQRVADTARVEAIRQVATAAVVDDWEAGRIQRQRQQEQEEWELRCLLLEKAKAMLQFGLARKVTKEGAHGQTINVFEPVNWDMKAAVAAVRLVSQLGRIAAQMPLVVQVGQQGADDDAMFETRGQAAAVIPEGAMPAMPDQPDAKPQLGTSITKGVEGLTQPEKARPVK
ncbi:MAG TPA: hypothetical protein VK324_06705 [Tepidisphaeraceae bacterium]|nr:hypothetical protein [Tepidisphaeraceae bacterium]